MRKIGDHAVVLGASMAGLLTARVLTESYDRVTIVERDALPMIGEHRRGVPQGRHLHGLLSSGAAALDELFSGFSADLAEAGAFIGDVQEDARWHLDGHRYRQAPSGLRGFGASRPLLEGYVRERVRALPGVQIIERCDGVGLVTDPGGTRVTGLRVLPRADGSCEQVLDADLVVDASGRGSRTPVWLKALGYRAPTRDEVRVGLGYASRVYRVSPDALDGDVLLLSNGSPSKELPERYGGGMQLLEHGRALVTLGGYLGNHPPIDPGTFTAIAATALPAPVGEVLRDAEPLTDPIRFTYPASVRNRYERLRRFPQGLLVIGDAVCSFNPLYGQGMSVAALEALALRDCLCRGTRRLPTRFFRAAAKVVDGAWDTVVAGDLALPEIQGRRTLRIRLINAYLPHVHAAAAEDARVAQAFLRVSNLVDAPSRLLRPAVVLWVLRARLRSGGVSSPLHEPHASEPRTGVASTEREPHPGGIRT